MANSSDDATYASRKLVFSFYMSVMIAVLGCLAAKWAGFAGQFPTVVGGLLGVLGLYLGANIGHNWVATKFGSSDPDPAPEAEPETSAVTKPVTKPVVSSTGSMTITKGSPADCNGEVEEDCSE